MTPIHRPLIFLIGGPNLGRLGIREPEIYGHTTWAELEDICRKEAEGLGLDLEFLQDDSEGEIVRLLHRAADQGQGVILNAAAYTHTSVAVRDAVSALDIPVIELHLTNPAAREPFRRQNLLSDVVTAGIQGFGCEGYKMALRGMKILLESG
jgi:3-dehydroquinate dehydratase-2